MASMRADGFRPAVHCWVLLGCGLGLEAAEFRRDAIRWVPIVAAGFRPVVRCGVSSECRLLDLVGL